MERAIMCPQCNAPLAPHPLARSVVCAYCGTTVQLGKSSIPAKKFHEAYRVWNAPESYPVSSWFSIGDNHWAVDQHIANGDISDVYTGQRARWPTELVIIKVLRDRKDLQPFDNEWEVLQNLYHSDAPGAELFTTLIPQLVTHGNVSNGSFTGSRVNIFRWASGFHHTFAEVMQTYPQGIPPRASIWVWRRILEILSFIHNSGMVHGAVLPPHLLVQENEHGVRLVGYGAAGRIRGKHQGTSPNFKSFYPRSSSILTPQLDIIMSARCVTALLGGDPESGSLPASVPGLLADTVQRVVLSTPDNLKTNAWTLREELGGIAREVFGPSQFIPIVMPS